MNDSKSFLYEFSWADQHYWSFDSTILIRLDCSHSGSYGVRLTHSRLRMPFGTGSHSFGLLIGVKEKRLASFTSWGIFVRNYWICPFYLFESIIYNLTLLINWIFAVFNPDSKFGPLIIFLNYLKSFHLYLNLGYC